jgi:ATP-dependent helicase HrpA
VISYPHDLPITSRRPEIIRAIQRHQVVIISGETGCGKSTQIPKMCLEAGRGRRGRIGCTQPRRIAAITIAHRIAEEMREPLGRAVGYKIRFDDRTSRSTRIKILTDGMLLAETQSDSRLREYETLIIDEAHERSLNIDFLLGIVTTLLPLRPELKLIITSATLDIEKFSRAFEKAPVLEVGGRMYPVDVAYRPPQAGDVEIGGADYVDLAVKAVDDIKREKSGGDILVFMPTEQDILETCEILAGRRFAGVTVLPLYARLPGGQQGRIYTAAGPKIVVATNVAETSLTIPGIRYVVDTGLARISQYLPGARINSLPIRPVSQSSADQRKGRCGRIQAGVCVRLYSEEDYLSRPQFTPPEILRSNLAEVILRMIDLKLGHPLKFPFVDRPHPKNVEDGYETLVELGAIRGTGEAAVLTEKGRLMARMPLDPRISRILLEARAETCLREAAVIASALSIRDPRERPPEKASQADATHAPFRHTDSDFLTLLTIWDRYHGGWDQAATLAQKRTFCRDHFLSFPRMREWVFVHNEIVEILKELKVPLGRTQKTDFSRDLYARIHRSVLSGYLSNIAVHKDKNIYTAARSREVMVFPGSVLFNRHGPWIVAAEMIRTSRLFARTAARIDPAWLEALGGELCRSSFANPRWDKKRGQVVATERVTLFGLEIVADRIIPYGRIDPDEAHRVFIRSALIGGELKESFGFLKKNLDLETRLQTIEEKLRRREFLADERSMIEFYSRRLAGVFDLRGLRERIRRRGGEEFLIMKETDLLRTPPDEKKLSLFPDTLAVASRHFRLRYKFVPGEEDDGVTLVVPADHIGRITDAPLEGIVPGYLKEKIEALVKGLPKRYRKLFVPAAETAETIARELRPSEASLFDALSRFAKQRYRADIPPAEWARADIPLYLKMRVAVIDAHGAELAASRDLDTLKKVRRQALQAAAADPGVWSAARTKWERNGITTWDLGTLPEMVSIGPGAVAYPGLEPGNNGANLRLFKTRGEALFSHRRGVQSLLLLRFAKDLKFMERHLVLPAEYQKAALYFGGSAAFEKMLLENLKADVCQKDLRSEEEFKAYSETVVRALFERAHALWESVRPILDAYLDLHTTLYTIDKSNAANKAIAAICAEIRKEADRLVPKNFLDMFGIDRLAQLARFLRALRLRAERAQYDPEKDRRKGEGVRPFVETLERLDSAVTPQTAPETREAVEEFRWMVEEFKVSLFAPELGTAFPVSAPRLLRKRNEIEASGGLTIESRKPLR